MANSQNLEKTDDLPQAMLRNMHNLQLTASMAMIDGPGMTVAQAATTDSITYGTQPPPNIPTRFGNSFGSVGGRRWEIAQEGAIQIDSEDVPFLTDAELFSTVVHEMAHAMGFNPNIWAGNDLLTPDPMTDNNPFNDDSFANYPGEYGLAEYQRLNEDRTLQFVSLEQDGGCRLRNTFSSQPWRCSYRRRWRIPAQVEPTNGTHFIPDDWFVRSGTVLISDSA